MIILDKTYRIEADAYQYILYEEGTPDKKGRIPKLHATHHRTLEAALVRYYRHRLVTIVNASEGLRLIDAIVAVRRLQKEIAALREVLAREVDSFGT